MGEKEFKKDLEIGQKAWDMAKRMKFVLQHKGKEWKGDKCITEKLIEEICKNKADLLVLQLMKINLADLEAVAELSFMSIEEANHKSDIIIALPALKEVCNKNLTEILPKLKEMVRKNFLILVYIWLYDFFKSLKN